MTRLVTAIVAVVILGCLGLPMLLVSAVMGGGSGGCAATIPLSSGQRPRIGVWDAEQVAVAATIVDVGITKGVPRWGWVVALATAMQESGLRNLPDLGENNDHDSIGVFQQRPSQGWGTPQQLADPVYQAGKFYDRLLALPGWETMPLTRAAQAVQRSAYPNAYAEWTDDSLDLVSTLSLTAVGCVADALDHLPDGFTLPGSTPSAVVTAIFWALGQLGTPYSFGGSCTDPHSGDPTKQCDCSCLVILRLRLVQVCDLRESVEDTVVDGASVDTVTPGSVDAIVAELQSRRPFFWPPRACGVGRAGAPR